MGKQLLPEEGTTTIYTYLSDVQGCGMIRVMLPSLMINQFIYKKYKFYSFFNNYFIRDLHFYKSINILQFQRSATKDQLNMLLYIKDKIKPLTHLLLLYEIDDLLFDIPKWNYASSFYDNLKPSIEKILNSVDGIITSTPYLKMKYSKYNKNIKVIPNHLSRCMWGNAFYKEKNNKKIRILYPASSNHFSKDGGSGDIENILMNYIKKTCDVYDWIFVGGFPKELIDEINTGKIKLFPWQQYFSLPIALRSLNADIGIAPLVINEFNKSKSNIKALEYTVIGIPGVYTKIEPYKNLTMLSNSEEEFISKLEELIQNPDKRKEVWEKDYNTLKSQLFWEDNILNYLNTYLEFKNYYVK